MDEVQRLIRHTLTPFVVLAVQQEWLPDFAQSDVVEAGVIAISFAVTLVMSKLNQAKGKQNAVASKPTHK